MRQRSDAFNAAKVLLRLPQQNLFSRQPRAQAEVVMGIVSNLKVKQLKQVMKFLAHGTKERPPKSNAKKADIVNWIRRHVPKLKFENRTLLNEFQ